MRKTIRISLLSGVLLASFLLGACSTADVAVEEQQVQPEVVLVEQELVGLPDLYDRVNPAVVNIQVRLSNGVDPGGELNQPFESAQGSGFMYDDRGHFVTNFHVVNGVEKILVVFFDVLILEG